MDETKKRDYKAEYKKFQSSTKAKKYRAELNKYNRKKGTYGNGDGKDASHKGGKIVGFEAQSKNRGRAEKSRLKKETVMSKKIYEVKIGKHDIGMGYKGNGLTIWNRNVEKAGDYKNIAHIDNNGKITNYEKRQPKEVTAFIQKTAQAMKDKPKGESVNENKLVGMAIGIAKKMSGDMTGAIKKIEKISKGLSKQKAVKDALRQANESVNEGKLSENYKNSEWEVYVKDEKGNEKIVKKAKSKRAATILYNKIIKSDDYYEVGMKVVKESTNEAHEMSIKDAFKDLVKKHGGTKALDILTSVLAPMGFEDPKNKKEFQQKLLKKMKEGLGDRISKISKKYAKGQKKSQKALKNKKGPYQEEMNENSKVYSVDVDDMVDILSSWKRGKAGYTDGNPYMGKIGKAEPFYNSAVGMQVSGGIKDALKALIKMWKKLDVKPQTTIKIFNAYHKLPDSKKMYSNPDFWEDFLEKNGITVVSESVNEKTSFQKKLDMYTQDKIDMPTFRYTGPVHKKASDARKWGQSQKIKKDWGISKVKGGHRVIVQESVNENSAEKAKIVKFLIKYGNNPKEVKPWVDKHYKKAKGDRSGATPAELAQYISFLTANESINERHPKIAGFDTYIKYTDPELDYMIRVPDDNEKTEKNYEKVRKVLKSIEQKAKQQGTLDDLVRASTIKHWGRGRVSIGHDFPNAKDSDFAVAAKNRLKKDGKLSKVATRILKRDLKNKIQSRKSESVNEGMDKRQAAETLKQLGGNKFIMMTGAKNFGFGKDGLSFKIGRNAKAVNYVVIDLNGKDLYDMKFQKGTRVLNKVNDVYNDQLQKMFTKYTGMYTSLGTMGR